MAREDQILSECSPQCRHIEDRYSILVGEWVAGTALDARTTAGIVGRTLSSAASAVCLGGIAGFNEGNSLQDRAAIGQGARASTFQMLAEDRSFSG